MRSIGSSSLRWLLIAAVLMLGCGVISVPETPTGVHLVIVFSGGSAAAPVIDTLHLRAQFREGAPLEHVKSLGRPATSQESLNLVFADAQDGEQVQLFVEATGGGTAVTSGLTVVTLKRGRYVDAAMTLRLCAAATADFCDGEVMVTCDPVTDVTQRVDCPFGCSRGAGRCKECVPDTAECQGTAFVVCGEDGFDISRVECAEFGDDCRVASCTAEGCEVVANADGTPCDDGLFCTIGTQCNSASCTGGAPNLCADDNSCTVDSCDERNDLCNNDILPDATPCDDGLFCTAGDACLAGICLLGLSPKCVDANPCTAETCDEVADLCSFACAAAGQSCFDATQEVTCDAGCNATALKICTHGCNAARQICNACTPSSTACVPDVGMLCNARVACDANGQVASKTCCVSNRCNCAGTSCLEDVCESSPDLSAGGTIAGDTCDEADDIPGSCGQGGTACLPVSQGGAPDAKFRMTLDDDSPKSAFYDVVLSSSSPALDTQLRFMTVCGVEASQMPNARVCASPGGSTPAPSCSEKAGAETMVVCGVPEGEYFGAVDSAAQTCGEFALSATVTPVSLDKPTSSGNVTRGGTFRGNTCGMGDDGHFLRMQTTGVVCPALPDCAGGSCPACNAQAATDCRVSDLESKCTYSGRNSPDAVFFLALNIDSGVDISTEGSNFDTVLYIVESGKDAPTPTGQISVCNDDCLTDNGASHIQTALPAGLYFVFVDGAGGACGDFVLHVTVSPAATCPNLSCEAPFEDCASCPTDCRCQKCGDGVIQASQGELCDDGGMQGGDGCGAICNIEPRYKCAGQPSACVLHCGDGVVDAALGEECDDRGAAAGDGCDGSCKVELGWMCSDEPSFCRHGQRVTSCPEKTVLAGDAVGIDDLQTLVSPYVVGDVTVSLDIGDPTSEGLEVTLISPTGTAVLLHDHTPGNIANVGILGNYDLTLAPAQALSALDGEAVDGEWQLKVAETYWLSNATLHCWTLNIETAGICGTGTCEGDLNETCVSCPGDCPCPACSNGIVEASAGERCDDGGAAPADGCDTKCQVEPGYKCQGQPSVCALHCGDGVIDRRLGETCDDGGSAPGDGCDASCAVEPTYKCVGEPSSCVVHCGDGLIDVALGESCDDGGQDPSDGCTAACLVDPIYKCSGQPSVCVVHCGDGLIDQGLGEECDDGDQDPGDGCDAACLVDSAYKCSGQPSACIIHCGDGAIDSTMGEVCDDGNDTGGDGCSASCALEPSYTCSGQPSTCVSHCGDGIIDALLLEMCDDNGATSDDGCSATCQIENGYFCTGVPSVCGIVVVLYNGEAGIESVAAGQYAKPAGWSEIHSDPSSTAPMTPDVNWHVGQKRAASGTRAWYYGYEAAPLGGSYSNGVVANSGTATSPSMSIPSGYAAYVLRVDVFANTETASTYDQYGIRILIGGVSSQVFTKAQLGGGSTGGLFVRYHIPITAAIGGKTNVSVQLFFDTIDSYANSTDGVFFDTLQILGVP